MLRAIIAVWILTSNKSYILNLPQKSNRDFGQFLILEMVNLELVITNNRIKNHGGIFYDYCI
jgi:hypothetical protein